MDSETRQLTQLLEQAQLCPEVVLLKPVTTSTNDDVREIAQRGIKTALVSSARQTQGRGQHQRSWVSPEGNIYLSTLVHSHAPLDGRLSLEIGLNILQCPTLEHLPISIKWPNDLYSQQGKWGGILVEPLSATAAIVGVGINLHTLQHVQLDQKITSLQELGLANIQRIQVIAETYLAIQQAVQWFNYGCRNLAARFNHHAAFLHEQVQFTTQEQIISGVFHGISMDGAVQIDTDQGLQQFYQGRLRQYASEQLAMNGSEQNS